MGINLTQEFVFESDSIESLGLMTRTISKIFMSNCGPCQVIDEPPSFWGKTPGEGKGLFLLRIEKYPDPLSINWGSPIVNNDAQMVAKIMRSIENFDPERLAELPKDSFYEFFDGSVGVGFRLETSYDTELFISAVPIYYGK